MTPVLFRAEKSGPHKGEVTAVFPTIPGTREFHTCTCYARVGQHSSCTYGWYQGTRPARPDEFEALRRELESLGYSLKIVSRWTRHHDAARRGELQGVA